MGKKELDEILQLMPEITKAVNAFNSETVQKEAFHALISVIGIGTFLPDNDNLDAESETTSGSQKPKKTKGARTRKRADNKNATNISDIVNKITDAADFNTIEENILKKLAVIPRILLCCYFANVELNIQIISSTDVQGITDELKVCIMSRNVVKNIKKYRKYFHTQGVPKAGQAFEFKINKKGIEAYKKVLKGEKI